MIAPTCLSLAFLLAPPTLGDGLRAIGALAPTLDHRIDHRLDAPPPPPRVGAKLLIGAGAGLIVAGIAGTIFSPGCATRDRPGRCVDPHGSASIFPALIFLGLAATVTGSYAYRQEVDPGSQSWE